MELSKYSIFLYINQGKTENIINYFQNSDTDVNICLNNFNWTPLHIAAYQGNAKLVDFLLKKGANYQIANSSGLTAKGLAESKQQWDIVDLIQNYDKFS